MGSSANVAELPGWALDVLERTPVGRLGLLDDTGAPRVLPVTFALTGTRFVSAIDAKPKRVPGEQLARVRWLRARPRAALTVDHYEKDWSRLAWVQALGDVRVLQAARDPEAVGALSKRYEAYRVRPPVGLLLSLEPASLLWWRAAGD